MSINGITVLSSIFSLDLSLIIKVILWSTTYHLLLYVVVHLYDYHHRPNKRTDEYMHAHTHTKLGITYKIVNRTTFKFYHWSIQFYMYVINSNLSYAYSLFPCKRMTFPSIFQFYVYHDYGYCRKSSCYNSITHQSD